MGFISRSSKGTAGHSGTTIVATGTYFKGQLKLEGAIHIDGQVEGQLESSSDISIGREGTFEGDIKAARIVVSGYMNGKIDCDRLEIVSNGKVFGEVTSRELIIEPGGQFIGESHVRGEEPPMHHLESDAAKAAAAKKPEAPALEGTEPKVDVTDIAESDRKRA